ncbi:MAG: RNase adapter RapZ [Burkholderiales bacterium]|nr:RNase adapter RapZ [Burkholderiales bacterium]
MQIILISGLSGSGKSIALNVLEDAGYYCVDNLPLKLLSDLTRILLQSGNERIAVSIDVRSIASLPQLPQHIHSLKLRGMDVRLLFLEAKTETLVKRFSETRRKHPLSDDTLTLPECIESEREMLSEIRDLAHKIDTSDLSANVLRTWIQEFIHIDRSRLSLLFQSFGFKHGLPLDSDMVFDIRCLPNPFYDLRLRPLTGKDAAVVEFLESEESVGRMYEDISGFVETWLPSFIRDNRNYLSISIGCTGGQHRSVYMVERLARHFSSLNQTLARHRELK